MSLFKRYPKLPRKLRTGHAGDDQVLLQIGRQSDLGSPRHWVHYVYCEDEQAARQAESDVRAGGWDIQLVDEVTHGTGWVVVAESHNAVTSPAAVREARAFFEGIASRLRGGEYDGWEASL